MAFKIPKAKVKKNVFYELECPNCKTRFEVFQSIHGKPPFDVDCPNCFEEVPSEFITGEYEE